MSTKIFTARGPRIGPLIFSRHPRISLKKLIWAFTKRITFIYLTRCPNFHIFLTAQTNKFNYLYYSNKNEWKVFLKEFVHWRLLTPNIFRRKPVLDKYVPRSSAFILQPPYQYSCLIHIYCLLPQRNSLSYYLFLRVNFHAVFHN